MEPKKEPDGDVEMNPDEPSSPTKHGDISPINGSISNLADEGKGSASTSKPPRKAEPLSEMLPNMSRVTPAQLAYITFPSEGRYQPVRAVSSRKVPSAHSAPSSLGLTSEKYAGGGGILILADQQPDEEAEFIEFDTAMVATTQPGAAPEQMGNGHAIHATPTGPHIALDESLPDADPPEPFEVRLFDSDRWGID